MGVSATYDTAGGEHVRQIAGALPFFKLYTTWIGVRSDSEVSTLLRDSNFDYSTTAIVENTTTNAQGGNLGAIENSIFSEDSLSCTVNSIVPCMLLINDLYYMKWHAKIDENEVPIHRAFTALRAVPVPAGRHHILMYYDDGSVKFGVGLSIAGILICLIGFLAISRNPEVDV
jgi:hypothetical protein